MLKIVAAILCALALPALAGTEWQVKKLTGTSTTRSSLQYKVEAGTKCEPEVVDQSSTGTTKYHLVPVKTTLGVTIKVPFECVLVAVPDPVPPVVVPPVVVTPPVVTPPPPLSDFAARCAAPGVVKCVGFDSAADIAGGVGSNSGVLANASGVKPAIDTAIKASGAGSLKFTVPSNSGADTSGLYFTNFSADLATQFGENSELYAQWRQRFSPEFLNTVYTGGNGWKQVIIGSGDQPGGKTYSSCSALETVVQNTFQRGYAQMYNSCTGSASHGPFVEFQEAFGASDWKLQNARPSPFCLYSQKGPGRFTPAGNCIGYFANEWMTFQLGLKTGPRVGDEWKDSTVSLWIGRDGQPSQLAIEYKINLSAGDPLLDQKFGKVWLLPYHTNKDATQPHPEGYVWYDDLIISRTRIADPSSMVVIVPAPAPVGPPVVPPPVVAPPPGTTALSSLAVSMAPGTWAELATSNITPTLDNLSGASGMMTYYTDSLAWDTIGEQAFAISADHLAPEGPQFASYSAFSNSWQRLPRPGWLSGLTFFHGYAHTAIDAVNRVLYHRPYGQNVVHRYDIAAQAWTTLPAPNFVNTYANCCDALAYFPELGGLVWIRGVAEAWLFKESAQSWTQIGKWGVQANNGGTWTFARYNPVAKVVVFGSGNSGDLYKLDAGATITQLKNPPVHIYDGNGGVGVLTADPVSGQFLFLSPTARDFYSYDVNADTWQAQASTAKPAMTNLGVVATPVPEHGVNLFAACTRGSCRAYLYKHR